MKLNAELLVIRGVISSLDEQQQAKVTECHKHLKTLSMHTKVKMRFSSLLLFLWLRLARSLSK